MKDIHIIGGDTVFHIRPHFALSAPAYGTVARRLANIIYSRPPGFFKEHTLTLHLTKMAGGVTTKWDTTGREKFGDSQPLGSISKSNQLETNEDIKKLIGQLTLWSSTKIIFMTAALCDFEVEWLTNNAAGDGGSAEMGKHLERLKTGQTVPIYGQDYPVKHELRLKDAEKVVKHVRATRKDIFLVGIKATAGLSQDQQFDAGLRLLKKGSCNLVLANDVRTKMNMIITPEQARYSVSDDRDMVLNGLVEMTLARSTGRFTRSIVAEGERIGWDSDDVPESLRTVVNHCIKRGAYKPFLDATVGHFAFKKDDSSFITSVRKANFNEMAKVGMVLVQTGTGDEDRVLSFGGKPSVGGQSQRIIFKDHPDVDCIVHFHCPLKHALNESVIPVRSQWYHECGSHECGKNTSYGLLRFGNGDNAIKAVFLDKHGPNIVFNRKADPNVVISFIEEHFDLTRSTSDDRI